MLKKEQDLRDRTRQEEENNQEEWFVGPFQKILEHSMLFSALEPLGNPVESIQQLCNLNIPPFWLSERDIHRLTAIAELLSYSRSIESYLWASVSLCEFINEYTSETTDLRTTLHKAYTNLKVSKQTDRFDRILENIDREIRNHILDEWLVADPIHYIALSNWAAAYVKDMNEMEGLLDTAIQLTTPYDEPYHKALWDIYKRQGVNVLSYFEKAIDRYPNQGLYYLKFVQHLSRTGEYAKARDKVQEAQKNERIKEQYKSDLNRELRKILLVEATQFIREGDLQGAERIYRAGQTLLQDDTEFTVGLHRITELRRGQEMVNHYGSTWRNIASHIVVEISSLVANDSGNVEDFGQESIKKMNDKFGVVIPRPKLIQNNVYPEGSFVAFINNNLVASRVIDLDLDHIDPQEVVEYEQDVTSIPQNGKRPSLIKELERLVEPVLEKNLVKLLGHQEVYYLLVSKYPENEKFNQYNTDPQALIQLTAVLRGLISEGVPIKAFKTIVDFVEEHGDEQDLSGLINKIRLLPEVRKELPGNRHINRHLKLNSKTEKSIKAFEVESKKNGLIGHALPVEISRQIITSVRRINNHGENLAIVVENDQLRPLINQLIQQYFINTAVITRKELLIDGGFGNRVQAA